MKTKVDLTKYEDMYDTFDSGHNRNHMEAVRKFAIELAQIYAPDKIELAWVAATLHDIGLSVSPDREVHEINGYNLIKNDKDIRDAYSKYDFEDILHAIREHRASRGKPETVIAKIVSDSDRVSEDTYQTMKRTYDYNLEFFTDLNEEETMNMVVGHLKKKFGENGTGRRLYFKESLEILNKTFNPIFEAYDRKDYDTLLSFIKG